jgi:hypothetical protein
MLEPAGKAKKRVALVCTVWGAKFLEIFCDYSLASLLAPANLPWASASYDLTFVIYTTKADVVQLQAHENVRRVAELVDVKFIFLETLPAAARHGHWIQWQHAFLRAGDFSAFVLIIPDCVYANSLLQKVLGALAANDIVYYSLPQVCLEPIVPRLRRERTQVQSHSTLDLTENRIISLFLEYINPKHAVAIYKPDYFITHPEYVLAARKGRLELTELACHPLAVSSRATSLSYSFNPADESPKTAFLEILGFSCELTLKYIEQYFRWRSDRMDLSRCSNLASWDFTFREQGALEYAKTKTDVALSGLEALSQQRTEVTRPQVVYGNAAALYQSAFFSLYSVAASCDKEVRQFIALAMHLPGFRKAIMRQSGPLTIMLPLSIEPVDALDRLYSLRKPELLIKFLLAHVVHGKPLLKVGQYFVLDASKRESTGQTRLQAIDGALAPHLTAAVTGTITSQPVYLTRDVVVYMTRLNYGSVDELATSQHSWLHSITGSA